MLLYFSQWTDGSTSCTFESAPVTNASCHDKVDLSLCFEDTAILFGICAVFWVLAGLTCCHRNSIKPSLDFGFLHAIKLVCQYSAWHENFVWGLIIVKSISSRCNTHRALVDIEILIVNTVR